MEVPKDQIPTLLDLGLSNSAQMLGCFLVSSSTVNADTSPHVKAENLHIYKQALQHCKIGPKQSTVARNSLSAPNRSSSPNSFNLLGINENEVKFKIASCHCSLNENRAALVEMEGIPSKSRNLQMNLLMGKLYRNSAQTRAAIACYKESLRSSRTSGFVIVVLDIECERLSLLPLFVSVGFFGFIWKEWTRNTFEDVEILASKAQRDVQLAVEHCHYVIEAIIALAELGVPAKDIISLFPQVCWLNHNQVFVLVNCSCFFSFKYLLMLLSGGSRRQIEAGDLHLIILTQVAGCSVMLKPNVALLQMITKVVWNSSQNFYNVFLITYTYYLKWRRCQSYVELTANLQLVEAIIGKNDEAIMNFEKVRSIDPYLVTYMDEYAMLLKIKSDHSKLNKLVHDLLSIDPTRPEVFVALSALWERKDERGALSYAEKSIRIDERHIPGHIMKGNLFLSMNRPEAAVVVFRGAQALRPDLRSYQGLVRSYLALSKIKEALHSAREAMKAMPQSAKALKLVGDVHASNSGGREKAKKFYESALRLEPGYLGAALALAELHVIEGRNGDAVSLLERYLKDWVDDSLHVKLAQVYAATNMLQEALSHFQAALRINPQNEAAKKGLERLEKQMKGVDPDAPEEDEENEVEDADGDQIETELL
ncbi:hypothetical protein RHGRI_012493 [Rhododendron griersonianum]|uniref:Anaphase-promoting complex subunit 7 n=1 Tax=Rhododendron griersonianum TaxID=479676 RepID=A0AAV6KQN2_9ERIC|nr:hypothetical protein RHGRI_012493 [Rhododendron griersonianum]